MSKLKSKLRHGTSSDTDTACVYFERMEPRILFSADALAGLVSADPFADNDSANAGMNVSASASYLVELYTPDDSSTDSLAPTDTERALQFDALRAAFDAEDSANQSADSLDSLGTLLDGAESSEESRQEIIFVDAATPDYQQLLAGLNTDTPGTNYQIFILQSDRDGIEQISEILGSFDAVDAIHLVSHGDETGLQLGNGWLSGESLVEYQELLSAWSNALDEDADLLIYGCNLAGNIGGQQLIDNLAELTGADVAASDDFTGAVTLGGDWQLEYTVGDIESSIAINTTAQQTWSNVLATFTVTTTNDVINAVDGLTSLREAIIDANSFAGADEIILGPGTYTLTLGSAGEDSANEGDLDILSNITITGADSATTIIDAGGIVGGDRVFDLDLGASLAMSDVTVQGGDANTGGNGGRGGGFYIATGGLLTLDNVVVQNNLSSGEGAGIYSKGLIKLADVTIANNTAAGDGGGIYNIATAASTLDGVTFNGNLANNGGGIYNVGTLNLSNATLSGNTATTFGGGIHNTGTMTLDNNTITLNNASVGGGIFADGSETITNNIIAGNSASASNEINGTIDTSGGYNIIGDGAGDSTGGSGYDVNDILDTDPMLGALQDNGGPTQTHALLSGSIAINGGIDLLAPNSDQRDQIRIGTTDIGAYEFTDYGLIWGDVGTDTISIATLDSNHVTDLITGLDDPASVAIDPGSGKVYWANEGDGKIQRANLDGTDVEDIVTGLTGRIALDLYLAGGKIYWADGSGTLFRANLDGSVQEVISTDPDTPTGIAVDGPGGMVYWVDDGSNSIGQTDLTGTPMADLVTMNVDNTADLTLDLFGRQIYWTDTVAQEIWRADLGGTNQNVGSISRGPSPYGLALDPVDNKTYWSDSVAGEIRRMTMSNGSGAIALYGVADGLASPRDVDFFTMTTLIKPPPNADPVFIDSGPFNVDEGAAPGTVVGNIDADDGDGGAIDAGINYTIVKNVDPDGDSNMAFTIDAATGEITVNDPDDLDFDGANPLIITVEADDGVETSVTNVTIDINDVIPTGIDVTAPLTDSTLEDTDLVFSVANGNEITVGDGTIDDPVLRTILTVTNGTLSLATTAGLTSVTGDGTGTVIVIGAESDINTALDGLTYAPTNNYSGPADLTVTTDLQADLLGFYEFEINGDIGDDTSPNGTNDGTVVGATQIIDGTRGNVLHLDGIDDVITIPGTFGDPQNLTLAAWVQLDAASGSSEVISLGNRVILRLDETFSGLGVFGSFYDGSSYLTTSSGTFIAGDGWHHVAYTLDGTTNEQTLYIDGLAVDTTNHANAVVYAGGNSALGRHASSASYFLEGEMDDARIYDRALGASEIQALAIDQFSDTETVSITVDPANDMPTTTPVVLAPIAEDSGVRLITQAQLLVNANDDDGDPLTAASLAISAGSGTLFDNGDGTWNYTPALNDDSSVSFSYTISDGIAAPIAASASLDITPLNDIPTTTPVVLAPIAEDSGVRLITQAQLLVNANDDDGDPLTAASLAISAGSGTLFDNGDGTWNYTPALNDDSSVSFSYTISDGIAAPIAASASLDITPLNDIPTTTPVVLAPIAEDSGVRLITQAQLLVNANDDDGDPLTAASLAISAGSGTLFDNGDGTWNYTPALNDDSSVSFSYTISDGIAAPIAASASLDITPLNDMPTTTPVVLAPIAEDSGVRLITQAQLLVNANDDDGDPLTAASLAISAGSGTLFDNGDGTWNYTPALNDDSSVSFSYTISDGIAAPIAASASLDITPLNDIPTTTPVVLAPIAEDSGVRLITQAQLLVNANDDDGDPLTAASLAISAGSGTLFDNGDGTWNYTPALNDDSSVSFSYTISDGIAAPIAASASLDITPLNDIPTTTPVVLAPIAEDSGVRLITQAQLLVNANDDDGDPLTAASLAISAGSGTLFDNGDGTWNYTPALNDDSSVSFSYTISDGIAAPIAASASLDITPLNDMPTATNLSSTSAYNEGDASVAITDIVVSDIDAGETITATLTLADTATGSLSANDGATYTAGTGVWTITGSVAQVNTALANLVFNPTVNNEVDTSIDVNIDDGDEDGSGALTGIITLDVTPVNDAPTATNLASGSTYNQGDASLPLNDIVISDVDSGETVTATLTLANVSTGSLSANDGATYNATTGVWTITGSVAQVNVALANLEFNPTANNTLDTTVAISIDDGDEDSSGPLLGAMNITVNPLPVVEPPVDPPIIESEPDDPVEIPETEPPVEAPVEEVVVELTKDNPLLVVGSGPVIPDVSDDPAPSLLADSVVEFIDPDARVDNSEVPRETSVAKPVGVETLLIKLREQLEFFDDPMQLIGAESFITRLNDMREALVSETENTEKVIGSSLTVTAGFSVGYVVWLARSGVLLSSVLSSLPAWRFIDPLPVLAGLQGGKGDDDEESLESMVEEKPVDDASQDAAGDDKSDA